MTRWFITQYKCTTCDKTTERPSQMIAHYRDEHATALEFDLVMPDQPTQEDPCIYCGKEHHGWCPNLPNPEGCAECTPEGDGPCAHGCRTAR
ncbi:MAG: hypothetical protein ACXVXJ_04730 [Mycobacteriaceae bacterium]